MKGMPLPFDFQGKGVLDLELVVNRTFSSCWNHNATIKENSCFADNINSISTPGDSEPTSVLDTIRSQSPPTSSSTLSSSLGGNSGGGAAAAVGGGAASTDTAGVAAVSGNSSTKWHQEAPSTTSSNVAAESELQPVQQTLEMGSAATANPGTTAAEKCTMEEWESVLPESVAASPSQDQSILRWIMGDVDDPSMANLNKVLQIGGSGGGSTADYEFSGGFGVVDQGFGADPVGQVTNFMPSMAPSMSMSSSSFSGNRGNNEKIGFLVNSAGNLGTNKLSNPQNPIFHSLSSNLGGIEFNQAQQQLMPQAPPFDSAEIKTPMFNPQVLINQHQTQHQQNPSFFMPLAYGQQEQNLLMPPQAKRHNPGPIGGLEPGCQIPKASFSDTGQELFMGRQPPPPQQHSLPQGLPHQLQLLPHYLQQRPPMGLKPKIVGEEMGHCQQQQQQQAIIDQLFKVAELVQTGNPLLAQEILARLNHQLSPIGKPFFRAAFYCKEALQLLLQNNNLNSCMATSSPFSLIFKIGAYKSFSEISPIVQFANFTCNQALLEALEGFDHIHVIDFDIGYGGQWASFMKELTLRTGAAPSLKITAFASPSTHDQLELSLTQENLVHFASEINIAFEFDLLGVDSLNSASWSLPIRVSENEAIAVNLPVSFFSSCQLSLPLVLRYVKHLSPKVVVSVDRGCDRMDLPFPNHVIHALQSYSNLLESLDAVNLNLDSLQKIERFLLQPGIEKVLSGRYCSPEKTQHWRTLFLSSGFSPLTFSNFTESQAAYLVNRTPFHGFHVEKRQSSLVLCWQRKELISATAWRC